MDHANVRVLITGSQYPVAVPERVQKHASDYSEVTVENGCMINMLLLDIDAYEEKYGEKAVRKNLTIPAWLNTFAEKNNINFSKLLQDTLFSMAQTK